MRVFNRSTIREAEAEYPNAAASLRAWHKVMEKHAFTSFADLRNHFGGKVDKVDHCYVFNIHGNDVRLIAKIVFKRQYVFIKRIFSHADYDKEPWYDNCHCDEP